MKRMIVCCIAVLVLFNMVACASGMGFPIGLNSVWGENDSNVYLGTQLSIGNINGFGRQRSQQSDAVSENEIASRKLGKFAQKITSGRFSMTSTRKITAALQVLTGREITVAGIGSGGQLSKQMLSYLAEQMKNSELSSWIIDQLAKFPFVEKNINSSTSEALRDILKGIGRNRKSEDDISEDRNDAMDDQQFPQLQSDLFV